MSKACIGFGCDKVKAVGSSNVSVSVRIKSGKRELELDMGLVWFDCVPQRIEFCGQRNSVL